MATKDTLEAREADCSTPEDYVALAREALQDPADAEYAKDLLEKGELECQMPVQYVAVAEGAHEAGLGDYAGELYEQAEEACFEAAEFVRLGHSLGAVRGDKEKAREVLEKAAEEAKSIADHLQVSQAAREGLGDEELARTLLDNVVGDCKVLDDYKKLAGSVLQEAGDADLAREFYKKAEGLTTDLDGAVGFAEGAAELFEDKDWAAEILEEAESDCQFTQQFVTLAGAYHRLTGSADKVGELMEQAEEFAMSGEEQLQLAEGAWKILNDKDKARAAYEKALAEIADKDELFSLASTLATDLEDLDLAKQAYAKAEDKLAGVGDASKLMQAVKEKLQDETFVAEILDRAATKFGAPADAAVLAKEALAVLGDKERAERLFGASLAGLTGFAELRKLLDTVREEVGSDALNRSVVEKLAGAASSPAEFLAAADCALEAIQDKDLGARMLDQAEERVASLPEMKGVVASVERLLADDTDRVTRVKEKLKRRELNQDQYDEFQAREEKARTFRDYVELTDEMMSGIDDRYYAAKLLRSAEGFLGEGVFLFDHYRILVQAVEKHLGDAQWVRRLLDAAGERATTMSETRKLASLAAKDLADTELGASWARTYLEAKAEGLPASEETAAFDYTKLARTVAGELDDKDWGLRLLTEAETRAKAPQHIRHVGQMFADFGDAAKASALYRKAFETCSTAADCMGLVIAGRGNKMSEADLREHYELGGRSLGNPQEKLRWAEGIRALFQDQDWAVRAFDDLSALFASPEDQRRLAASRDVHLR